MLLDDSPRMQVLARFVQDLASISKCEKRKVAAIIIDKNATQVYSIGINGGPKGGLNCLCNNTAGRYSCVHAEANALAKCTAVDRDKIMICTLSPCVTCASLIVNNGFKSFYYLEEWKDKTGIDILQRCGVDTHHLLLIDKEAK